MSKPIRYTDAERAEIRAHFDEKYPEITAADRERIIEYWEAELTAMWLGDPTAAPPRGILAVEPKKRMTPITSPIWGRR